MLSFLREQIGMGPSGHSAKEASGGNPPPEGSEQEYLTVSSRSKQVRKSTIFLAVLFGVGVLCLFVMIKKSTPQSTSAANGKAEEAQIETAISRITGVRSEMYDRMDEIVGKFYEFSDVKQVGLNELSKNPFEHQMFLSETPKKADNENEELSGTAELMRQQQLWQQSRAMQLLSIMQSDEGNCCMIDDKILYKGDKIGDFTVVAVGDTSVKLECNDIEVELKLSE